MWKLVFRNQTGVIVKECTGINKPIFSKQRECLSLEPKITGILAIYLTNLASGRSLLRNLVSNVFCGHRVGENNLEISYILFLLQASNLHLELSRQSSLFFVSHRFADGSRNGGTHIKNT